MTKAIYIIGTVISVLLSLLLGGQIASAASPYDNIIHPTDTLNIRSRNGLHQQNISTSLLQTMQTYCNNTFYESFTNTMANEDGKWIILQLDWRYDSEEVRIIWTDDVNAELRFSPKDYGYGAWVTDIEKYVNLIVKADGTVDCEENGVGNYLPSEHAVADSDCAPPSCHPGFEIYYSTFPVTYPSGYEGELIPGASARDLDQDGISDAIESPNYPNRDDVFCGVSQCAYPDPTKKDIYLELDWMKNGSSVYKPTSTQLFLAEYIFETRDINVHFDTGQYGGGNELPTYIQYLPFEYSANPVGFFDLKNGNANESIVANFDSARDGIWRYLITGYGYDEDHSSSGASYTGSGNVFVSLGTIEDNQSSFGYTSLDTAIAGTIVHELAHSLCMSQTQKYSYQSADCQYSGVDAYSSTTYGSVLNYNLQMFQTALSAGSNGAPGDHDDWAAIKGGGIADFASWNTGALTWGASTNKVKQRTPVQKGITIGQAQAAQRNGTLGMVVRNGRLHDLRKGESRPLPAPRVNGQLGLTY